jgi:hypothetical protein
MPEGFSRGRAVADRASLPRKHRTAELRVIGDTQYGRYGTRGDDPSLAQGRSVMAGSAKTRRAILDLHAKTPRGLRSAGRLASLGANSWNDASSSGLHLFHGLGEQLVHGAA